MEIYVVAYAANFADAPAALNQNRNDDVPCVRAVSCGAHRSIVRLLYRLSLGTGLCVYNANSKYYYTQ